MSEQDSSIFEIAADAVDVSGEWWPRAGVLLSELGIGWTAREESGVMIVSRIDGLAIPDSVVKEINGTIIPK